MEKVLHGFESLKWKDNCKIKLLIIVGTRPEIIRLSAVITKCREYFDTILAHTGQNYKENTLVKKSIHFKLFKE